MAAPLTETRRHKIEIIREISRMTYDVAWFPLNCLDKMDIRKLKEVLRKLKELYDRAKPY